MKTIILTLILITLTNNLGFSQNQFNWNDIKKVELFSFSTVDYCSNIKSEDLKNQNSISCDRNDFQTHLMQLIEPEFDVIFESNCLILRIEFSDSVSDFILFLEQGILMDLNNYKIMKQVKNRTDFNKLIKKYLN